MKKTLALIMVAMMAVGCFAQLPSVTLKNIDGKTVDTAKLNNNGKPFIDGIYVNISHSKDLVSVIISDTECGIDIQYVNNNGSLVLWYTDIDEKKLKSYLTLSLLINHPYEIKNKLGID
mgnify:CR=1 FL=1